MSTNTTVKLPARSPSAVFRPMADGGVIFSVESEVYFGVNTVGASIWELLPPDSSCDTIDAVVRTLAARFTDVGEDVIRRDVMRFVAELVENGLATQGD